MKDRTHLHLVRKPQITPPPPPTDPDEPQTVKRLGRAAFENFADAHASIPRVYALAKQGKLSQEDISAAFKLDIEVQRFKRERQ